MDRFSVNSFSNTYETLYRSINSKFSSEKTFATINNSLLYVYFCKVLDIPNYETNIEHNVNKLQRFYGKNIFFRNNSKDKVINNYFISAVKKISKCLNNDNFNIDSVEEVLGNVLEKHVNRKKTGSYYTPNDTTEYIASFSILISALKKCSENLKHEILNIFCIANIEEILNLNMTAFDISNIIAKQIRKSLKDEIVKVLYELKIIDPTCGSGAFIVAAINCLESFIKIFNNNSVEDKKLINLVYGLDLSKESVCLTKVRLMIRFAGNNDCVKEIIKIFRKHFVVADAFKGSDFKINEKGFSWKFFGSKFDCVIGNPPYVEAGGYVSKSFYTKKCGNLYAYSIERACNIISDNGVVSFIVPLSLVSTKRMDSARKYLENCCSSVYYGLFADRPGCIFKGVHQRLTIFFGSIDKSTLSCEVYSSNYKYWYNKERPRLFTSINYYPNKHDGILPKIGNKTEDRIYNKIISGNSCFSDLLDEGTNYDFYMSTRIGFWMKAFDNNVFSSNEYKKLSAKNSKLFYIALALLNSSTFYFYWVLMSDCWHVTSSCFENFRFNKERLELIDSRKIKTSVELLMKDLEENKEYIGTKQTAYEYKHKYSKEIIDNIDDSISDLFSFNKSEIQYIKSYTELYRMNTVEI